MLRLNDTEYEIITEVANATTLPVAEYARKQITNKQIFAKYEIAADVPELRKMIAEYMEHYAVYRNA